jgi:hypothetical protein
LGGEEEKYVDMEMSVTEERIRSQRLKLEKEKKSQQIHASRIWS